MGIRDIPVDLYLAGHTHGGQIRIPFGGPIIIPSRVPRSWARGFRELGATRLNVSAGIGCEHASRLPSMRLFCPPEMTVFSADRTAARPNPGPKPLNRLKPAVPNHGPTQNPPPPLKLVRVRPCLSVFVRV